MLSRIRLLLAVLVFTLTGCAGTGPITMIDVARSGAEMSKHGGPAVQDVISTPLCPYGMVSVDKSVTAGNDADVQNQDKNISFYFALGAKRRLDCVSPNVQPGSQAVQPTRPSTKIAPVPKPKEEKLAPIPKPKQATPAPVLRSTSVSEEWKPREHKREQAAKPAWESRFQKYERLERERRERQYSRVPKEGIGHKGFVESDVFPGLAAAFMQWKTKYNPIPPCTASNGAVISAGGKSFQTNSGFQRERFEFKVKCNTTKRARGR